MQNLYGRSSNAFLIVLTKIERQLLKSSAGTDMTKLLFNFKGLHFLEGCLFVSIQSSTVVLFSYLIIYSGYQVL